MKRRNKCANKVPYSKVSTAQNVILNAYKKRGVLLRYYECPVCLDFHLTSKNVDPTDFSTLEQMVLFERQRRRVAKQKKIIAKQYAKFCALFKDYNRMVIGDSRKKPKTILKGKLALTEQRRICEELKQKRLFLSLFDFPTNVWKTLRLLV